MLFHENLQTDTFENRQYTVNDVSERNSLSVTSYDKIKCM